MTRDRRRKPRTGLGGIVWSLRHVFLLVGLFSLFSNMAMFVAPLYMLQVYDRVLVSSSQDTLIMLTALAIGMLIVNGIVEVARSRLLVSIGAQDECRAEPRSLRIVLQHAAPGWRPIGKRALARPGAGSKLSDRSGHHRHLR